MAVNVIAAIIIIAVDQENISRSTLIVPLPLAAVAQSGTYIDAVCPFSVQVKTGSIGPSSIQGG